MASMQEEAKYVVLFPETKSPICVQREFRRCFGYNRVYRPLPICLAGVGIREEIRPNLYYKPKNISFLAQVASHLSLHLP